MTYTIDEVSWHTEKDALIHIREQVFIIEQQVPTADEWDGKDESATHFLVKQQGGYAIGCARLLIEHAHGEQVLHIGRVAILAAYRHQGVGRELIRTILHYCHQQLTTSPIYLHAQIQRQSFYEHLGFVATGDVFPDAGIPHIEMWYKSSSNIRGL